MGTADPLVALWAALPRRVRKAIIANGGNSVADLFTETLTVTITLPPEPPRLTLWQRAKRFLCRLQGEGDT